MFGIAAFPNGLEPAFAPRSHGTSVIRLTHTLGLSPRPLTILRSAPSGATHRCELPSPHRRRTLCGFFFYSLCCAGPEDSLANMVAGRWVAVHVLVGSFLTSPCVSANTRVSCDTRVFCRHTRVRFERARWASRCVVVVSS